MSIKYLSVPDFHFSMKHLEASKTCAAAVADAARESEVDFIAIPGDWFDSPIMATDKGGIQEAKNIMDSWLSVCPVCVIEGTPSHDNAGCYKIFPGVKILKPGKVYGLISEQDDLMGDEYRIIREVEERDSINCIIFGIPELNKNTIQAQLNLSAEQSNATVINLFDKYIEEFVAPMRMKYKNVPAIGLFHGNITDSISRENETDNILKRSDILISIEILEKANLDYWNLGHIHKPWTSEKINASYAGSPGFSWNEKDFVPGFELIELDQPDFETPDMIIIESVVYESTVKRIPYGTPERKKVNNINQVEENPNIAYWLETDELNKSFPEGWNIHPLSKQTLKPQKKETQRVSEEDAKNIKSLWDLFKIIDPNVDNKIKDKVDLIAESVKKSQDLKLNIEMTALKVVGCDFFDCKTIELNLDKLNYGLTSINGEIGEGKSSLLSFCSPYPIVIGKETQSGRQSAIKDFFSGKDSMIIKRFIVNDNEEHVHTITIKGAHTQTQKVECYLNINEIPQLEKGTFDEMLEKCQELYGPFEDYRLTSFYEQPQQSTKNQSGLMTVGKNEARNVVQNIAGIDRDQEKEFSLEKIRKIESVTETLKIEANAKNDMLNNSEPVIKDSIAKSKENLVIQERKLNNSFKNGDKILRELKNLQSEQAANNIIKKERDDLTKEHYNLNLKKDSNIEKLLELKNLSSNLEKNRKLLKDLKSSKERIAELEKRKNEIEINNSKLRESYLIAEKKYNEELNSYNVLNNMISSAVDKIKTIESIIELSKKPCEYCGKISSSNQKEIDKQQEEINKLKEQIEENKKEIKEPGLLPEKPILESFDSHELDNLLSANNIDENQLQQEIEKAVSAEASIKEIKKIIEEDEKTLKNINYKILQIEIDENIDSQVFMKNKELEDERENYTIIKSEISKLQTSIDMYNQRLKEFELMRSEIDEINRKISESEKDLEEWKYISTMLSSNKIPALELDIIITAIDEEATRNIKPFMDGRYSFQTVTQKQGKKSVVDKFDIIIFDSESGEEKSMFFKNPGHKSFFSDAYIKALIRKRKERFNISYNPIILDEADGPISPEQIPVYYNIQNDYFKNEKVLIVSHSTDAKQFIQDNINISSLKR